MGDKLAMTAEDISGTSLNELGDSDEIYLYLYLSIYLSDEISFVIVLSLFPPHSVYLRGPLRLNARHRRQHVAPCEQLAPERGGKEGIG